MQKFCQYLFLALSVFIIFTPVVAYADGQTFGEMLDDLAQAEAELEANNNAIQNNENQIDENNATIQSLRNEILAMGKEAEELQQEIVDANAEIEAKKEQTKSLIEYLQLSQGENVYLEYAFGAETVTDLIYRLSVVEQIAEYNDNMVAELETMIQENEDRKVELANRQEEYEQKMVELNNEISSLNSSIQKLDSLGPGLEEQVEAKKSLVEYYRSQGCSNRSDVIGVDCAASTGNAMFSRPMRTGYVTSFIGYRWGSLHRGIDLGSSTGRNTPLYSIGYGVITDIYKDAYGALCVAVQYKYGGEYYTAIYAHMSRYGNIYEGQEVTPNTILGYMGDTGYAFGVHLHLEVWPCRLYVDSECSNWSRYVSFVERQYGNGFRGAESVIAFPSTTYTTWYTK